jgi:two-component system, OmpR family, alkaline phosphatase synthesis response regulator PhoP
MIMTNTLKLMIVEDEANLADTLYDYFSSKKHECVLARNAAEATLHFQNFKPQVILMDINLPDGNGIDLARQFRSEKKDFIILFFSALNEPSTKVAALELGAEDYITKPFDLRELNLRLSRILEWQSKVIQSKDELKFGALTVWFKKYQVQDALGNIIDLSQKECAILDLLYQNCNEVVSRDDIIDKIWGSDAFPSNRTVDNYIVKLRKWTDTDPSQNLKIQSIRSIGYKLIIKGSANE